MLLKCSSAGIAASQEGYNEIGVGVGLYRDYGQAQQLYFQLGYIEGNGITYKGQSAILWMIKPLINTKRAQ